MKTILYHLFEHKVLDRTTAKEVLMNISLNKYNQSQISAFLSVYLMRVISVEELAGFRDALIELCLQVDLSDYETIDVCGTGGDAKNSFELALLIPEEYIKISESGINDPAIIPELKKAGYNGFLIGEFFMCTGNPQESCSSFIEQIKRFE